MINATHQLDRHAEFIPHAIVHTPQRRPRTGAGFASLLGIEALLDTQTQLRRAAAGLLRQGHLGLSRLTQQMDDTIASALGLRGRRFAIDPIVDPQGQLRRQAAGWVIRQRVTAVGGVGIRIQGDAACQCGQQRAPDPAGGEGRQR